jgi:hypothetical protein
VRSPDVADRRFDAELSERPLRVTGPESWCDARTVANLIAIPLTRDCGVPLDRSNSPKGAENSSVPDLGAIFWANEARSQLRDGLTTPGAPSRFPWSQGRMTFRHLQASSCPTMPR